jgi:hypothetical protein
LGEYVGLGELVCVGEDVAVGSSVGCSVTVGVGVGSSVGIDVGVTGVIGVEGATGLLVGDGTTIGLAAAGLPPEKKVTPPRPAPAISTVAVAMGTRRRRSGERGTYMAIGRRRAPRSINRPVRLDSAERLKC